MLDKHLIVRTEPVANENNIVYWQSYRITVLADRLFRIEKSSNKKYRDSATQSIWFRNRPQQKFSFKEKGDHAVLETEACKLIFKEKREECLIELDGKLSKINNEGNLLGTYRTLDGWDGEIYKSYNREEKIPLEMGVCSKTGIAVFDDVDSLTLGEDGEVKPERGDGSDEYVFAYGANYRDAVNALFMITGKVPLIPRFALGNWWSRYHVYTDKEYLRLLNIFEEENVPLTVATIDMDWHYSDNEKIDEEFKISENNLNDKKYVGPGSLGWTGYTWNRHLFPDYQAFLKKIKAKNLRITLNLHPADGIRFWDNAYEEMAQAFGVNPETKEYIPFDIADANFINRYFSILHKPYEKSGVDFWWVDWQQGISSKMEGLDPLWALNHYHYLDIAVNNIPLILSRYSGIGSHRYPVGFSGDTYVTWETLKYLPYFTANASNIGYTWWSHDIGGHQAGYMENELYVRFIQYGVFSPINRLHCSNSETMTKEPWAYNNGAGAISKEYLRFRHRMIPYLYSASYKTHKDGLALIEPLYYQWDNEEAYLFNEEYLFGGELLLAPITEKAIDGFACVNAWIPEGKWTDIFTGDGYQAGPEGKTVTLLRELEFIPVLAREGAILPLSMEPGNSIMNPEKLEIWSYLGNNEYILYEDGILEQKQGEFFTIFKSEYQEVEGKGIQTLKIKSDGDASIIPDNRTLFIRFKNIEDGFVRLYVNNEKAETEEILTSCIAIEFPFNPEDTYQIEVSFKLKTEVERLIERAKKVLLSAEGNNNDKLHAFEEIRKVNTIDEYLNKVENSKLKRNVKLRMKETL